MLDSQPVAGIPGASFHRIDRVPAPLAGAVVAGLHSMARPGALRCVMPEVGTFLVRDGVSAEYCVTPDADPGWVALVLHGTVRGALIHQRGELPLHAATLVPPGGDAAVAFCGDSGAGKSTLAFELLRRGWTLVADDTTRVMWDGSAVMAWPSRPRIKLWRDACETAGIDCGALERVTRDLDKYYVPVGGAPGPVRLAAIVELTREPVRDPADRSARLAMVTRHSFRPGFIRPLGVEAEHLAMAARTVSHCALRRMPAGRGHALAAVADTVESVVG